MNASEVSRKSSTFYGFEKLVHLFGIPDQNFICYQSSERCRENADFNAPNIGNIEADNLLYGNDTL